MSFIRTLAVDPTTRGFCYVLMEGSEKLLSWGCAQVAGKEDNTKERVASLVERNAVELLVVEDPMVSRRQARARERIKRALDAAVEFDLMIWMVSREDVRKEFQTSGTTKHEIATALARQFPELARKLPPKSKPWESEPQRMNVFDAMSFALTALSHLERQEF